jgi:hypothetical protein
VSPELSQPPGIRWAPIALREENYPTARTSLLRGLHLERRSGDLEGQAATLRQLGFVAAGEGRLSVGIRLVALGGAILRKLKHRDVGEYVLEVVKMAEALSLETDEIKALLVEASRSYEMDAGATLLEQAFGPTTEEGI